MVFYEDENLIASTSFERNTIPKRARLKTPIMNVYCSLAFIYVQIFDYQHRITLSYDVHLKKDLGNGFYIKVAKRLGELIAKKALAAGITEVIIIEQSNLCDEEKALAEAAREAGLKF